MDYYRLGRHFLVSDDCLEAKKLTILPQEGEILYLFRREPLTGRESFAVSDSGLLTAEEGVSTLTLGEGRPIPADLAAAIAAGRVRAVNMAHPRWRELLEAAFPLVPAKK